MSLRVWSVVVVLLSVVACRSGDGVAAPSPSTAERGPDIAVPSEPDPEKDAEAVVEPTPEPSVDEVPVPPDLRDGEFVRAAGRLVVVSTVEDEPTPEQLAADEEATSTYALEVSVDGATEGEGALSLPADFEWCENHEAVVEAVKGGTSPLVFAQALCESGEDEFSRDMLSVVIHVGDASTASRILWQGKGSSGSSFGVCEHIDVPSVAIVRPGVVRIEQHTEVVKHADPDRIRPPCRPKKARVRTTAEIEF